jgi:hypothetical protein
MNNHSHYCFICGFDFKNEVDDDVKFAIFTKICDCCLFQYGIDDTLWGKNGLMAYRQDWIETGLKYRGSLYPNDMDWNLPVVLAQLKNLRLIRSDQYFSKIVISKNINWNSQVNLETIEYYWKLHRKISDA